MIEILKSFEQVASRFSPPVLMVPGLVMVALGLVAWLGGMCVRRPILALFGAAAGAMAAMLAQGWNPVVAGLAALAGALFGALLPRLSAALLLAAVGMAVALVVMTRPSAVLEPKPMSKLPEAGQQQEELTVGESLDAVHAYALNIADGIRSAFCALERPSQALLAAIGFVLLVLGLFLVRLTGALTCSALGTALVFAGLTALLILKGSDPITLMERQGRLYGLVLLGMTAFGTLEQLVLCPSPRRGHRGGAEKTDSREEESGHHSRSAAARRRWKH
ncbi:MAG: hypothetical protein M1376_12275 [Planctomycetes bacterium]|nr:hypothetical protein [Planctomycetota bacterium]